MLFLLLTTAFATTWHREVTQEGGYTTCAEIATTDDSCASTVGPALTGLQFIEGSCPSTDTCPDWLSSGSTFLNQIIQNSGCSDITTTTKCSGDLPNPGNADLSGCDLTNIDIQNVMTCVPSKCEDFQTGGCASSSELTDCIKEVYAEAEGLNCEGLIELPDLSTCGENPLACVNTETCDMSKCSSFEQFGCASCVTDCVTTTVGQSFSCDFADQITSWTGNNGFQIPTDCDVSCLDAENCEIPMNCDDYAAKVSAGGCASCLGDCARTAVASAIERSVDTCTAVLTTWSTTNFDSCSSTSTESTDVASCVAQNCAMPKDCDEYKSTVSSGGCAACLGDCARTVVAQTFDNCDAILNLGNNNASAGALSLVLALVGSILYHF